MKIGLTLALLTTIIVTGCDQNQGAFHADGESSKSSPPDPRAETMWGHNLTKAQTRAKAADKLVLIDFTGSDWCPPCMGLHDNVFTQKEFLDYAEKKLELVVIDFPKNKPLDETRERANQVLSRTYKVTGFPTVIVLDGSGKELHRSVGYGRQNAKTYTAKLQKALGR